MPTEAKVTEESTAKAADLFKKGSALMKEFNYTEARQVFKEIIPLLKDADDVPSLGRLARTLVKIGCIDDLNGKITVVIIAHRLSTIKNSDYIYVLEKGMLLEEGTYKELSQREGSKLSQMLALQSV